jgi:glycosyltransferase involved in cell wall biosynthesis
MRVLVLSAYDADSHRRWYQTLMTAFDEYQWTLLSLPARYFSWRVRGNSLSWAFQQRAVLERDYDLVIATSMVDLSALRGFVPSLATIPTLVYFHENQFAYPTSGQQFSTVEPQILNLYTALAADRVVFNSAYNQSSFLQGVEALLAKLPDQVPMGLVDRLARNSQVLPVPLEMNCFGSQPRSEPAPLQLLWNHRWEYDKAPERLFAALKIVLASDVAIKVHVVGQQFRQVPPVFAEMKTFFDSAYPASLGNWGYIEEPHRYRELLGQADVVISTALHDFQGLAVMEAVAAGCVPLLPGRLCYPEWFGSDYLYSSYIQQPEQEAQQLADGIIALARSKQRGEMPLTEDLSALSIERLKGEYAQLFAALIAVFYVN